jgi:hypothetical protein
VREQDFQNEVRIALTRELPVRVGRLNAGKAFLAKGGVMEGVPSGVADLGGGTIDGTARIFFVELKAAGEKRRPSQVTFARLCRRWGWPCVLAVYDPALSLEGNAARVVELVRAALALPPGRGVRA